MKKLAMILVLLLIVTVLSSCKYLVPPEPYKPISLADQSDPETVKAIMTAQKQNQARRNGDTYCIACDKFIEGKVRICTYCGEYI